MKTLKIVVYDFDELSDKAKEKARDWYREGALDYDWWDSTYEDAERIGLKITEFDLGRAAYVKASFMASAEETAHKIETEHGETCATLQDAKNYLKERDDLVNTAERDANGELVDEYSLDEKLDDLDGKFLKTLCEDYRIILEKEMEYLRSDESVDETIRANGYTFTETGKRMG